MREREKKKKEKRRQIRTLRRFVLLPIATTKNEEEGELLFDFTGPVEHLPGPVPLLHPPWPMGKSNSRPKYVPFSGSLCLRAAAAPQPGWAVPVCYLVLLVPTL